MKWNRHPHTPSSFCKGITFSLPFKMQQLFPIELLLLPLLLAFNKAWGYQRVKEKLPWLCCGPDCTIRAVREALYKGRARGRARWRLALPPDKSVRAGSHCLVQPGSTRAPQFRVGTWQVLLSNRAVCTRLQSLSFPKQILYCCPCQGLFVYPHRTIMFPTKANYSSNFSKLFCIFSNFID